MVRKKKTVLSWARASVAGSGPSARTGHSCSSILNSTKILIFGGWDGSEMQNDFHVLHSDLEEMAWEKVTVEGDLPRPRAGHTMTSADDKVYVFGGGDGRRYLNDLYCITVAVGEDKDLQLVSKLVETTGTLPQPRSRHTMTALGNKLILFGGTDGNQWFDTVMVMDLSTNEWTEQQISGQAPTARWGHSCSHLVQATSGAQSPDRRAQSGSSHRLLYFGGNDPDGQMMDDLFILDTASWEWVVPEVKEQSPPPAARAGHSSTLVGRRLYVFGGGDGDKMLNDLHILNTDQLQWQKLRIQNCTPPIARAGHTAELAGTKVIIFGGGDGFRRFKDLYYLETADRHVGGSEPQTPTATVDSFPAFEGDHLAIPGNVSPRVAPPQPRHEFRRPSYRRAIQRYYESQSDSPIPQGDGMPATLSPTHVPVAAVPVAPLPMQMVAQAQHSTAMMEHFLHGLGLVKFMPRFVREEIFFDDLRHLRDEDLAALGLPMGPRRRLLAAVTGTPSAPMAGADNLQAKTLDEVRQLREAVTALTTMVATLQK